MRLRRDVSSFLCVLFLAQLSSRTSAKDLDSKLFNTFYCEGAGPTWVLQIRRGNTYTLVTPDGQRYEGWYNASGEEIGLNYGQSAALPFRHFEYKLDEDGNISFTPTKKDQQAGLPFGNLPPAKKKKVQYLSEQVWSAAGKRTVTIDNLPVANAAPSATPLADTPPPQAPVALQPLPPVAAPVYTANPPPNSSIIIPPPPPPQNAPNVPNIPVNPESVPTTPVPPIAVQAPVARPNPPVLVQPPVAVQPPISVAPPVPTPAVPVAAGTLIGKFEYHANAAVTEFIKFNADGTFEYADSQTVKVPGTFQGSTSNGQTLLTLTAGQEVRRFEYALTADGQLTLTRATGDVPQFINDLSYMSPAVIKSVKYQRSK